MIVLDASVITKWFKPDEKSPRADKFFDDHTAGRQTIAVPILLLYEITNALWNSRRLTIEEIIKALTALNQAHLSYTRPDNHLFAEALRLSQTTRISIYDASYLALALNLNCSLITADKKFYQKAKGAGKIVLL